MDPGPVRVTSEKFLQDPMAFYELVKSSGLPGYLVADGDVYVFTVAAGSQVLVSPDEPTAIIIPWDLFVQELMPSLAHMHRYGGVGLIFSGGTLMCEVRAQMRTSVADLSICRLEFVEQVRRSGTPGIITCDRVEYLLTPVTHEMAARLKKDLYDRVARVMPGVLVDWSSFIEDPQFYLEKVRESRLGGYIVSNLQLLFVVAALLLMLVGTPAGRRIPAAAGGHSAF